MLGIRTSDTMQSNGSRRSSAAKNSKTVDGRTEGGHWEGDLIICKRTRPVLVLHERKSRVTLAARLAGKTAAETISVMLAVFARIEPTLRKSITSTMIPPSLQHALLRTMRAMTTWFCDAYASWQKGGVKTPTVDYATGCLARSTSTKCPTKKSRTSSSPPISRPENAWAARRLSKRSSKSLAKTCKSGSHRSVALGSRDRGSAHVASLLGCESRDEKREPVVNQSPQLVVGIHA